MVLLVRIIMGGISIFENIYSVVVNSVLTKAICYHMHILA